MNDLTVTTLNHDSSRLECAIYARFSSDKQRESSIDDQVRVCRNEADKIGGHVPDANIFADREVRGARESRPQLDRLMELIRSKRATFTELIVADTSRLARNSALAPKLRKTCEHNGIRLHFVQNGMVSGSSGFNLQHTVQSYFDESYSTQLGVKVYEGQIGCVSNGYKPSGRCYGYRGLAEEHPYRIGLYNRPEVVGVRHTIYEPEAEVVRQIFTMYASGFAGYSNIAKFLNEKGIESPRKPRKNTIRCWNHAAISTILKNERYIGRVIFGRKKTVRNPDTEKVEHQNRPPSEWTIFNDPDLRIVSDELWAAVVGRRKFISEGVGAQVAGGLARSTASRSYLFSGLLRCGECKGTMVMANGPEGSYYCGTARRGAGCRNKRSIRLASLQRELAYAIASTIRSQANFDTVKAQFMAELTAEWRRREGRATAVAGSKEDLLRERKQTAAALENLAEEVGLTGGSGTLRTMIEKKEARMAAIDASLAETSTKPKPASETEIDSFLRKSFDELADIILADPIVAKSELQKRISALTLTPTTSDGQPAFRVSGDMTLFSGSEIVLLTNTLDITSQQQSFVFSLGGLTLKLDDRGEVIETIKPIRVVEGLLLLGDAA